MRKLFIIMLCIALVMSFAGCNKAEEFTATESRTILSEDGTEYIWVGAEGMLFSFGEVEFVGGIKGEDTHNPIIEHFKYGIYSVNGQKNVIMRYSKGSEFRGIYVRSDLYDPNINYEEYWKLENYTRLGFSKSSPGDLGGVEIITQKKGITNCKEFVEEIKSGKTVEEAGLRELLVQPDGSTKRSYTYGWVYGFFRDDLAVAFPATVLSYDDKAYAIYLYEDEITERNWYVLPQEWLDKLSS